jgi:hypothetical protein
MDVYPSSRFGSTDMLVKRIPTGTAEIVIYEIAKAAKRFPLSHSSKWIG